LSVMIHSTPLAATGTKYSVIGKLTTLYR